MFLTAFVMFFRVSDDVFNCIAAADTQVARTFGSFDVCIRCNRQEFERRSDNTRDRNQPIDESIGSKFR